MNYQTQLNPWAVYCLLSDFQRQLVARFRTRNEAECYVKLMGQMQPQINCVVVFETAKPTSTNRPAAIAKSQSTPKRAKTTTKPSKVAKSLTSSPTAV